MLCWHSLLVVGVILTIKMIVLHSSLEVLRRQLLIILSNHHVIGSKLLSWIVLSAHLKLVLIQIWLLILKLITQLSRLIYRSLSLLLHHMGGPLLVHKIGLRRRLRSGKVLVYLAILAVVSGILVELSYWL